MEEVIRAAAFFDGATLRGPCRITIDAGSIVGVEEHTGPTDHHLVTPGLFDLQMNGYANIDVSAVDPDELVELDAELFRRGTTRWLATIVTAPLEKLTDRLVRLDEVVRSNRCAGLRGVHLEGPFLGGAPGAHRRDWIVPIDPQWLGSLPSSVRLVTLAAEQPGAFDAVRVLVSRGVAVSVGHSTPTNAQVQAVVDAGATMVTHLFNGMSGVHHRQDGLALQALIRDEIVVGLIADMVHVNSSAVKLAFRAKGPGGVCLVSDTVAWRSPRALAGNLALVDGAPRLPDGTLAGSATELARAVRNCVLEAGVPLVDAVRAATSTPTRLIDATDHVIGPGSPVNLVAFDDALCVAGVWRGLVSHRA